MVFNFKMKIESWFALLVLLFLEKMAEGFIGKSWQSEDLSEDEAIIFCCWLQQILKVKYKSFSISS